MMFEGIYTIWLRNVKRYLRSRSRIIGSLGMPLFFLIIIGFGLDSVMSVPGQSHAYVGFIVPGIVAMSVLFTSIFSGIQIIWDRQFGFLKETLVAPVSRAEIMIGQTIGGATAALIQGLMILIVSLFIGGTHLTVLGVLIAIGFMIMIGIAFTAMGIAFAARMQDMHGFQLIMNFVVFPLFGLSGALFPIDKLPLWLKTLTHIDPLTYGVEGIRYGLLGVSTLNPWLSFTILALFSIAMICVGGYLFRHMQV